MHLPQAIARVKASTQSTIPPEFLPTMASNPVSPMYDSASDNESAVSYESTTSKKFACDECGRNFATKFNVKRHMKSFHDEESSEVSDEETDFECDECERNFATKSSLRRHKKSFHDEASDEASEASDEASQASDESSEASDESSEASDEESNEPVRKRRRKEERHGKYVTSIFIDLLNQVLDEYEDEIMPVKEEMIEEGLSEGEAEKCAILSSKKAKKKLQQLFIESTYALHEHLAHPLLQAITKKARDYMKDGLEAEEAITSAVKYRKHAIYDLIKYV